MSADEIEAKLLARVIVLEETIRQTAEEMERWVRQTATGGWSTQHVEPMQKRALQLWATLGRPR